MLSGCETGTRNCCKSSMQAKSVQAPAHVADASGLLISSAGYYNPSNQTYANGVMASYVLPLALGAVPTSEIKAVSDGLLRCLVPSRVFF